MPDPVDPIIPASGDDEKRPSYESFQKVLGEKKAALERAKKIEDELAEAKKRISDIDREKETAERKSLEEKEQFKDLYGKTKEELEKKDAELASMAKERLDARKMSSFLDAIKAEVPRQYWNLVDIDQIAMEGDKVDDYSVQKYVEKFRETYKEIIKPRDSRGLPIDRPPPGEKGHLTYEEWMALPVKEKEQKISLVK